MQETKYIRLTGTHAIIAGAGVLVGMRVNTATSPVVTIWDSASTSTGTIIFNTMAPAVGYHDLGNVRCTTGAYLGLGGTADITFFIKQQD